MLGTTLNGRDRIEAGVDAPLGPGLRLAAALGGPGCRDAALARADAAGRARDARTATRRVAAVRREKVRGAASGAALARARLELLATRRHALRAADRASP